jgi:hypothetical protein
MLETIDKLLKKFLCKKYDLKYEVYDDEVIKFALGWDMVMEVRCITITVAFNPTIYRIKDVRNYIDGIVVSTGLQQTEIIDEFFSNNRKKYSMVLTSRYNIKTPHEQNY